MTDAGRATLPDLDATFVVATDIRQALELAAGKRFGGWNDGGRLHYAADCP